MVKVKMRVLASVMAVIMVCTMQHGSLYAVEKSSVTNNRSVYSSRTNWTSETINADSKIYPGDSVKYSSQLPGNQCSISLRLINSTEIGYFSNLSGGSDTEKNLLIYDFDSMLSPDGPLGELPTGKKPSYWKPVDATYTVSGEISGLILEMVLVDELTVTFDINGGTGTNSNAAVGSGSKVTAPEIQPTKDGYHFNGWYLENTEFDFANTVITENITLKAKFAAHTPNNDDGDCTTGIVCTVCGVITTAVKEHSISLDFKTDEANHWKVCFNLGCTYKEQTAAHISSTVSTLEHSQVCTICGYEIAPKLQAKNVIVDTTTGIKTEYVSGSVFDSNIVLSVTSKTQADMDKLKDNVEKVASGLVLGELYDLKLLKDGVAIQPNGKIKVSIPLTDKLKAMSELKMIYVDDNENITIVESKVKDGMITFVTDHFSNYGIVGKIATTTTSQPKTNDNFNIQLCMGLLFISSSIAMLNTVAKCKKISKD